MPPNAPAPSCQHGPQGWCSACAHPPKKPQIDFFVRESKRYELQVLSNERAELAKRLDVIESKMCQLIREVQNKPVPENEKKYVRAPSKVMLEEAERLESWAEMGDDAFVDNSQASYRSSIDACLEWLRDGGYLTESGNDLAHAFWYKYIYDDDEDSSL